MNDFTASNGVVIREHPGAIGVRRSVEDLAPVPVPGFNRAERVQTYLDPRQWEAIAEAVQAEADERLGRWRWPENTDFVVYPEQPGTDWVRVYSESQSLMVRMDRQKACHVYVDRTVYQNAARAYFDAHPEPKPWHEAQPGEVWVLETRSDLGTDKRAWHITDRPESFWALSQGYLLVKSKSIVSGYRIWPGVSS